MRDAETRCVCDGTRQYPCSRCRPSGNPPKVVGVYKLKMTAASPQGVPGEPPPGIWDGRKVAASCEEEAIAAASHIFPGWTVLTAERVG